MPYYQEFVRQNAILVDRLEMKWKDLKKNETYRNLGNNFEPTHCSSWMVKQRPWIPAVEFIDSVIGIQTLSCLLIGCALQSILSLGCPCSNVKCLWGTWLGLIGAFSSNTEWLMLDPEKVGSTSLTSKLFQSMRHVWTSRIHNQAFTKYLGSFWKHAREFGLLSVTGATTEIWRKSKLNSHAMCWACITKNWLFQIPLGRHRWVIYTPSHIVHTHTSFYLYIWLSSLLLFKTNNKKWQEKIGWLQPHKQIWNNMLKSV